MPTQKPTPAPQSNVPKRGLKGALSGLDVRKFNRKQAIVATISLIAVALIVVVFVNAAGLRKNIKLSFNAPQGNVSTNSDGSLSFNSQTVPSTPISTDSYMLPNQTSQIYPRLTAKSGIANPLPTLNDNIKSISYSTTGGNGTQGQFRVYCQYSHFNYDDPIVYPGAKGAAHLHMFWGNTLTNALSTKQSLTTSGGGSCNGYELNRTAYWMPALQDGEGHVVIPKAMVMYYKAGSTAAQGQATTRMPQGLKMIAGNSAGNPTQSTYYHNSIEWDCYDGSQTWSYPPDANGGPSGTTIPASCPGGQDLNSLVYFPQCWNGTGLERSDVAFANNGNCPAGWKTMPQVSYHIFWPKSPTGSYAKWYLSSDRVAGQPPKPNGSTLHGDWFGGWNDSVMDQWITSCINRLLNCGDGQMGPSNQQLVRNFPTDYAGPTNFLTLPTK